MTSIDLQTPPKVPNVGFEPKISFNFSTDRPKAELSPSKSTWMAGTASDHPTMPRGHKYDHSFVGFVGSAVIHSLGRSRSRLTDLSHRSFRIPCSYYRLRKMQRRVAPFPNALFRSIAGNLYNSIGTLQSQQARLGTEFFRTCSDPLHLPPLASLLTTQDTMKKSECLLSPHTRH